MPADRQRSRPVPSSTYRIQFSKDQTFDQVRELLPYLDALGAGALYASPLLESGAGSNHGYDVVDPTRISAERGGPEGLRALVAAVREHGLGFVLDIVPNHVGVAGSRENPWWWDVLRHGKESAYATYFDIDWDAGPILLPVLDADEEKALSELALSDDGTELRYYEHAAPVAPGTEGGTAQEVHERQHYRLRLLEARRGGADLPALLRRVHAGRGARGGPRGVRGHARRDPPLGRRGRGGRPARGPPGRAVGPRRLRAAAAGRHRAGPLAGRREDPGRRGGVARVVAGRRHVGLRGARGRSRACSWTRTARGCSPSSRPSTPAGGSRCTRPSTPPGARWPTRSSRPRCAASPRSRRATRPSNGPARPSPSCSAASPCTAPTSRRAGRRSTSPCRWPAPTAPTSPTCSTGSTPRCSPTRAASWPPACSRPPAW